MLRLHTDGRYIKDAYGRILNLRGTSLVEPTSCRKGVGSHWGQEDGSIRDLPGYLPHSFDLLKECGVNIIRLAVSPFSWMGVDRPLVDVNCVGDRLGDARYVQTTEEYRQNLDLLISELEARGIRCWIDCHSVGVIEPAWWQDFVDNYLAVYHDFLRLISQRYIDRPAVVGIQTMNEPRRFYNDYPYTGYWWDFCLETSRIIHSINPNLLVLVSGTEPVFDGELNPYHSTYSDWGCKGIPDQFTLNPLPEPNIVYAFNQHYGRYYYPEGYPTTPDFVTSYQNQDYELARQQFEAFLYKTKFRAPVEYNMPIMNCEFSIRAYGKDAVSGVLTEQPYDPLIVARDYMELMNKYGCGWTWWPWGGSVGYPWDHSPESGSLVYMSGELPIWDKLTYMGEVWKSLIPTPISPFNFKGAILLGGTTYLATRNPAYALVASLIGGFIRKKT